MIPPLVALGASVLPSVWNWITGEKAPTTITAISNAVAEVAGTHDPEAAQEALRDPVKVKELQIRLAEITVAAEEQRRRAVIDELKAEIADTANARDATLKLVQAGTNMSWAPAVISTVITVGFFVITTILLYAPPGMDERVATLLNVMLGVLSGGFVQVTSYWLGSSAGSKRNGESIRAVAESVATKR